MTELDPAVANEVPWADMLTAYDEARLALYLRLLDAAAADADWRDVARIVLYRDPEADPESARRCWESHLKRARWIAKAKYQALIGSAELRPAGRGNQ